MWYALVDCRSCVTAMTHLVWGTLQDIANKLISECNELIEGQTDGMCEDEIEEEYGEYLEGFRDFEGSESFTEDMIRTFSFSLSDMSVDVGGLVQGYPALVEAFEKYTKGKMVLDEWVLASEIEENEETLLELDSELRSLGERFASDGRRKYFIPKECTA